MQKVKEFLLNIVCNKTKKNGKNAEGSLVPETSQGLIPLKAANHKIPLIGVSLRWFIDFIKTDKKVKRILRKKGRKAKMDDLLSVVRDMTSEVDESFAEMLLRTQPDKKLTKPTADVFISYARLYLVNDMIPAIQTLLPINDESEDIYIWLDSLSINQRVKSEFDPNFFIKTLKQGIETISNVAIVLTPWDNPGNLTRAWCIWELYSAVESKGVNIEVLIPPTQRKPFREALIDNPRQLMSRIGKIDIEKAQAWSAKDRDMILDAARKAEGGIETVRECVIEPLRNWMTNEALEMVKEKEKELGRERNPRELARILKCTGDFLTSVAKFEESLKLFSKAAEIRLNTLNESRKMLDNVRDLNMYPRGIHIDTYTRQGHEEIRRQMIIRVSNDQKLYAECLRDLGNALRDLERYDDAVRILQKGLEVNKIIYGEKSNQYADCLINLADNYRQLDDFDKAIEYCKKGLDILQPISIKSKNPLSLAQVKGVLSVTYLQIGNYTEAENLLKDLLQCLQKYLSKEHEFIATTYNNLADCKQNQGNHEDAVEYMKKAIKINIRTFGENHINVALYYSNLGFIYTKMDEFELAEECLNKALNIRERFYPKKIEDLERTKVHLAACKARKLFLNGNYEEANDVFKNLKSVILNDKGNEGSTNKTFLRWIDEAEKAIIG